MSKNYVFEFSGTKEMFLNQLKKYPNNDQGFFYFDDYIVKLVDDEIQFGVERAGHSGGHWFIPTIAESDGKITLVGTIQHVGPQNDSDSKKSIFKKIIDKIGEYILVVLLAPFILIVYAIVTFPKWLVNKILGRSTPKSKTTEEKLFDLMENHLNCARQ